MDLEEQLKMATMTTAAPVVEPTVMSPAPSIQQPAQVAEIPAAPTTVQTAPVQSAPAPVQYANVQELAPAQPPVLPTIAESNGIQMIQLGQQFNTRPINVVKKLGIGEKLRFTLLNTEGYFTKFHFIDGMGKFACFEGSCCKELGNAKHRYVLPILVYPTLPNDPTTVLQGQHAELKVLPIWDDAVYDLIFQTSPDPINRPVDFIATGTDNFGRMSVVPQAQSYKGQFAADINKAFELWNMHKDKVPSLICKNMDEATYQEMKQRMQAVGPNNSANYNTAYGNNGYQNYNGIY